jgi:hypothetical protein
MATLITTAYIVGMSIIGFKRHRKKQQKEIEPLIEEMEVVLKGINPA